MQILSFGYWKKKQVMNSYKFEKFTENGNIIISIPYGVKPRELKYLKKYISLLEKFQKMDKKPYYQKLVNILSLLSK